MIHGKVWIPIIDGMNNKDILDYSGIYQTGMTYTTPNKRFGFGLTLIKRRGWRLSLQHHLGVQLPSVQERQSISLRAILQRIWRKPARLQQVSLAPACGTRDKAKTFQRFLSYENRIRRQAGGTKPHRAGKLQPLRAAHPLAAAPRKRIPPLHAQPTAHAVSARDTHHCEPATMLPAQRRVEPSAATVARVGRDIHAARRRHRACFTGSATSLPST